MPRDLPELRASHEDRDRVVDTLRTAGGDGRLTAEELDARVERALSARTQGELAALIADLSAATATKDVLVVKQTVIDADGLNLVFSKTKLRRTVPPPTPGSASSSSERSSTRRSSSGGREHVLVENPVLALHLRDVANDFRHRSVRIPCTPLRFTFMLP
jgi:hypothetical protein